MASKLNDIEKEIYLLPEHERALLAKNLLLSLESYDQNDKDFDYEKSWIEESKRRLEAFEEDETIGQPAEIVLKELRAKYK